MYCPNISSPDTVVAHANASYFNIFFTNLQYDQENNHKGSSRHLCEIDILFQQLLSETASGGDWERDPQQKPHCSNVCYSLGIPVPSR